jgi:UDP-arabinose 4-epimerase
MTACAGDSDNTVAGAAAGIGARVLVTGGAGYIGSHTCKALHAAGYVPVVLDSLVAGHREFVRWGPLVGADIRDTGEVVAAIKRHGVTSVVHFASLIAVGESVSDPALYYDVNVAGTLSLLRAMRQTGVQRIVFSSSAAVYGMPQAAALNEAHVLNPVNPYGWSKYMAERMLQDHAGAYGLRYLALRYFNACGADAAAELGECHSPETHLIPLAIAATHPGGKPLQVFGRDYDTPDGTCVRDYVHVSDLAAAHVAALRMLEQGHGNQAWNVGTGRGHSVLEIIAAIEVATGRPVRAEYAGRRPGDPPRLVADASLIQQQTTWRPQHSSIGNIIATAWAWHQGRPT